MKKYILIILILIIVALIPIIPQKRNECILDNGQKTTFTACVYGTVIDNHKPIIYSRIEHVSLAQLIIARLKIIILGVQVG